MSPSLTSTPEPETTQGDVSSDMETDEAPIKQAQTMDETPDDTEDDDAPDDIDNDDAPNDTDNDDAPDDDDSDDTDSEDDDTLNETPNDETLDGGTDDSDASPSSPDSTSTKSLPCRMSIESPPSRASSPAPLVLPTEPSPSQAQQAWVPSYRPLWKLGRQHRPYVHAAAPYLTAVPGGREWEDLLAAYITFEGLSSNRSVSGLLIDSSISLTDDLPGLLETPDQPTPRRSCTVVQVWASVRQEGCPTHQLH